MAFQFPAAPTLGQVYNAAPGIQYTWNGTGWAPTTAVANVAEGLFPDGTMAAPAISWLNEPNSGFYRNSNRAFYSVVNGVMVWSWSPSLFSIDAAVTLSAAGPSTLVGQTKHGSGSLAVPAISWNAESTSGFYRSSAGAFQSVISGENIFGWATSGFYVAKPLVANGAIYLTNTSAIHFRNVANNDDWPAVHHGGDDKLHIAWRGYPETLIYGGGAANLKVTGGGITLSGTANLSNGSYTFNAAAGNYGLVATGYISGGERSQNWCYAPMAGGTAFILSTHQPSQYTRWYFGVDSGSLYMQQNSTGYSSGGWIATSDRRLKENIEPIENAMSILRKWTGYTFDKMDVLKADGTPTRRAGLLAQEVQVDLPAAVDEDFKEDERFKIRKLSLDHMGPIAVLVNAVKELDARFKALEALPINELVGRMKMLERRLT